MVSLTNQARLLAAQAANKKILEEKARVRKAEIEAERQKQIARSTRRLVEAKANARNPVEAGRIQDSINQVKASTAEKRRVSTINTEARRKTNIATQRAFGASSSRVGILTGFVARKDSAGRIQGISRTESQTRKNTKKLLLSEIRRQQQLRDRETDLERFLKNERGLSSFSGAKAFSSLKRQIAQRKARGLSKTPAQKRAFFRLQEQEDLERLRARNRRRGRSSSDKRFSSAEAILARKRSEAGRAGSLGSNPFADPLFSFGGRSKAEVIARGGTFGRRVGGESLGSQISSIKSSRQSSANARINFAQSLLSGNLFGSSFEDSSVSDLLSVVKSRDQFAPQTFEQEIREGVGFFDTEATPITAPSGSFDRQFLVAERKTQDIGKTAKARKQIATGRSRQATLQKRTGTTKDDLSRLSADLVRSNTARGRAIEARNASAKPRFSLSAFNVRQQAKDDFLTRGSSGVNVFGAGLSQASARTEARRAVSQQSLSVSGRVKKAQAQSRRRSKPTDAQLRAKIAQGISVPQADFQRLRPTKSFNPNKRRKRGRGSSSRSSSSSRSRSNIGSSARTSRGGSGFDIGGAVGKGISAGKFLFTLASGGNPFGSGKLSSPREAVSGIKGVNQGSLQREINKNLGF